MSGGVISNENDDNFSDVSSTSLATEEDSNITTRKSDVWEFFFKVQDEETGLTTNEHNETLTKSNFITNAVGIVNSQHQKSNVFIYITAFYPKDINMTRDKVDNDKIKLIKLIASNICVINLDDKDLPKSSLFITLIGITSNNPDIDLVSSSLSYKASNYTWEKKQVIEQSSSSVPSVTDIAKSILTNAKKPKQKGKRKASSTLSGIDKTPKLASLSLSSLNTDINPQNEIQSTQPEEKNE
ncbi:7544_t:CDS:2 [Funneliformis caledonium]|uniref:7544_t:CDS:1 n=1 Tax=Funneliformis caledonium TaxID=1117310 RepID=A0A9N9HDG9_9GLOM|nr:7544_t:CDS:2 [Funneliformis caledonium]